MPAPKRGEILYRVGELLKKYKEEMARIETREMGKVLKETRGDVQEGIDCAFLMPAKGGVFSVKRPRPSSQTNLPCRCARRSGFAR